MKAVVRGQESGARNQGQAGVALLVVVVLAGCGPAANGQLKATADAPVVAAGEALEVVLAGKPARKTLVLTTTQPARLEAIEQAPIHSKLAAYVEEVLVDYGTRVEKGQALVKLRGPEVEAEVKQRHALRAQALAEVSQAKAAIQAAEAAVETAQARVVQAEAARGRAQADGERWQLEFARMEQLSSTGSINRQLVDETRQKLRSAEAALAEMVASIAAAKAAVQEAGALADRAKADFLASQSRVQVAEANIDQAVAVAAYLTISAPFDGVVTARQVDPGHFVQPAGGAAMPLLVVSRVDKIRVFIAVPETEAAFIRVGNAVMIEIPSLRDGQFRGAVARSSVALSADSRSLETIVDLDNSDGRIRPGQFGTAKIILEERADALTLPVAAVGRQGKDAFCFRLIGGKAVKTAIQLGIRVGDDFEIASGLSEGDACILNKAAALKDGQAVKTATP